ncbi:MAG: DUF424 family protein [Candidatus Aenigmarchaeota archaeon]|nr:DUF424 family protein [Candidatus Aenigmarchaeota archaeon]
MFVFKIYEQCNDVLLAIADSDIIGKTFEEGELSLAIDRAFYCGEKCSESDVAELIESATIVNASGNRIVSLLVERGFVDNKCVLKIGGLKHAQIVKIP